MNKLFYTLVFLISLHLDAQELFPLNEPASSIPKGALAVKILGNTYHEIKLQRNMGSLRLAYGLTPRLSVMATASISNHHNKKLPADLINHTHVGSQTFFFTQNIQRGVDYPYLFNGIDLYAKYRFLSLDGDHRHLRMAFYGEWSNMKAAHDEAEPNLMDDSPGAGAGLIVTWLKDHFAASLTSGVILSGHYEEMAPRGIGFSDMVRTKIHYGNAVLYNLSLGYLLYPQDYVSYSQSNWNVYVEFLGKYYGAGRVLQDGEVLASESPAFLAGHYVEIHPGIQKIINSDLRVDLSVGFNLINKSYIHFYPLISFGVQKYFFFKKEN